MLKEVDVVNMAFLRLGIATIADFDEQNKQARTAKGLFEQSYKVLLSIYPWSFAKANYTLAKSTIAPIADFKYAYLIPTEIIKVISLGAGSSSTTSGGKFRIIGEYLHTDLDNITVQALIEPAVSSLSPVFLECLIERLCLDFSRGAGDSGETSTAHSLYTDALRDAKIADGWGQSPTTLQSTILIDARK